MAKQKKEDNRDIFDKALDNAPTIGALTGIAVGALGGRGRMKTKMSNPPERALRAIVGGYTGAAGGALARYAAEMDPKYAKKRRK